RASAISRSSATLLTSPRSSPLWSAKPIMKSSRPAGLTRFRPSATTSTLFKPENKGRAGLTSALTTVQTPDSLSSRSAINRKTRSGASTKRLGRSYERPDAGGTVGHQHRVLRRLRLLATYLGAGIPLSGIIEL